MKNLPFKVTNSQISPEPPGSCLIAKGQYKWAQIVMPLDRSEDQVTGFFISCH